MPTYTYKCHTCEHVTEKDFKYSERPSTLECEECRDMAEYTISAPHVMRASFPDGHKRKGWDAVRHASKLNVARSAESNPETRKEISKEIKKLNVKI